MISQIAKRFENFISTQEGFESIDTLSNVIQSDARRADYFLKNRTIIIEQKVLEVDPGPKIQRFVDDLMKKGKLFFFGSLPLQYILDNHPDGKELHREIYYKVVKNLDNLFSTADKQIRATKLQFGVPSAMGLLTILNEAAVTLDTRVVMYRINQIFGWNKDDGTPRYPDVAGVLLLGELSQVPNAQFEKVYPILSMLGPSAAGHSTIGEDLDRLVAAWVEFNNATLIQGSSAKDIGWA